MNIEFQKTSCDVLVIGGGVAGMLAAIEAKKEGAEVILLTKATFPSGSSSMARGGFSSALDTPGPDAKQRFTSCMIYFEPACWLTIKQRFTSCIVHHNSTSFIINHNSTSFIIHHNSTSFIHSSFIIIPHHSS